MNTLNETIKKLNDILLLSKKGETAISTSNDNAFVINRVQN